MSKTNITSQLPFRKNKWSAKYSAERCNYIEGRERQQNLLEKERKGYKPTFVGCNTVTSFLDTETKVDPVLFLEGIKSKRNLICSSCCKPVTEEESSFRCSLCPASIHASCNSLNCEEVLASDSTIDEHIVELSNNKCRNLQLCNSCVKEIAAAIYHERDRLQKDRHRRLEYFSALKMQANLMRNTAQRRYFSLYNGMLRLQARVRKCAST